MEKEKNPENHQNGMRKLSVVRSIPKHVDMRLNEIGKGNWKKGLKISIEAWDIQNKNPEIKLMNDVDNLMTDLRTYFPDNHYEHFDNFPAFFLNFLKNGDTNLDMLNKKGDKKE